MAAWLKDIFWGSTPTPAPAPKPEPLYPSVSLSEHSTSPSSPSPSSSGSRLPLRQLDSNASRSFSNRRSASTSTPQKTFKVEPLYSDSEDGLSAQTPPTRTRVEARGSQPPPPRPSPGPAPVAGLSTPRRKLEPKPDCRAVKPEQTPPPSRSTPQPHIALPVTPVSRQRPSAQIKSSRPSVPSPTHVAGPSTPRRPNLQVKSEDAKVVPSASSSCSVPRPPAVSETPSSRPGTRTPRTPKQSPRTPSLTSRCPPDSEPNLSPNQISLYPRWEDASADRRLGATLNYVLKDYQAEDKEKCQRLENGELVREQDQLQMDKDKELNGFIINYSTGLGKTLLMIALISEQILRFGRRGTNLVVCPGIGLMYQWRNELNKFAPGLKVLLYRDSDIPSGIKSVDEKFMAQYDVVIVLYCQVRSQHSCKIRWEKEEIFVSEKNRWPLFKLVWHRVILDEAHTIRNSQCKTTLACFAVSKRFGYCLTATPIHNSVLDLFPLVCFINATYKGLTDEKVFREKICLPLRHHTTVIPRVLDELLADCLIYRSYYRPNGEPLIEMPHRFEHRYEVVLSTKEFIFYCFMHEKWYFNSVLARMTREQQGAVCPMLATRALAAEENGDDDTEEAAPVDGIPSPSPKRSPKKYANKHISEGDVAVDLNNLPEELRGLAEIFGSTYLSSKMWKSVDIYFRIQHDRPGDKVIIISRFRDTLEVLASYFRNVGIQSIYYRGDMSAQQRTEALRQLAEDDSCMICFMTVQSGGVGLNITSCNNVILLEPWWNPYIEEQAFGRVHRIGQKKDCHIYRLYALGTIDEQILETQEKKYKLVKGIFSAFEGPTDEDREEWMKGVSASLDIIRRTSSYSSGDAVI